MYIVIIAFVISLCAIVLYFGTRRSKAMADLAQTLELNYSLKPTTQQQSQFIEGSWLCQSNASNLTSNFVYGQRHGFDVAMYDFRVGRGRNSHTRTVLCVLFPNSHLPFFTIRQKHLLGSVRLWFDGENQIEVHAPEGFDQSHIVTGNDNDAVRNLLTPSLLQFFVGKSNLYAEGGRNRLLIYRCDRTLSIREMQPWLDHAIQLALHLQRTLSGQ